MSDNQVIQEAAVEAAWELPEAMRQMQEQADLARMDAQRRVYSHWLERMKP